MSNYGQSSTTGQPTHENKNKEDEAFVKNVDEGDKYVVWGTAALLTVGVAQPLVLSVAEPPPLSAVQP